MFIEVGIFLQYLYILNSIYLEYPYTYINFSRYKKRLIGKVVINGR